MPKAERREAHRRRRSTWCDCPTTPPASPRNCRAASSSASRWPARWWAGRKVLLLDEPLGALDLKLREQMQVELKAIQREVGITFVIVTHDQDEALTLCDRLAVFNNGRIEQIGAAARGLREPGQPLRRRLRRHVQRAHRRHGRGAHRPVGHVRDAAGADPAAARRARRCRPECAVRRAEVAEVVYAGPITRVAADAAGGTADGHLARRPKRSTDIESWRHGRAGLAGQRRSIPLRVDNPRSSP